MRLLRHEFVQFPAFSRQLDHAGDPAILPAIEEELTKNPRAGNLLKGGIRKMRVPSLSDSRGKSGGFRVWHYFYVSEEKIFLLYLLDKREAQNIRSNQEAMLLAALKEALRQFR